ncbi:hypothetical protein [Nitrolancea hollandica]|uniref:Uncharacterized protein n=1 Tax=Nitrolancea hollandica Lb TaxID=1129897 RepID=I4EMD8_9BACT|nr:hypothetical protein [Nitrolancea hollandica]CCF85851.1 hypothetical protein NITHO_5940006 [Nitrolancea hollandica Lb]
MDADAREQRDRLRQERAFEDYWKLGTKRSVEALFRQYVAQAREQGRDTVPTLHKPDLTRWRRDYGWDERVSKRVQQQLDDDRERYEAIRKEALDQLHGLIPQALQALGEILQDRTNNATRLRAVDAVLARANLEQSPQEAAPQAPQLPQRPPENASEEEKLRWFQARQQMLKENK